MIDRIQNYLQKPMIERTIKEEVLGCLIILFCMAVIWLIGEVIYRIEEKVGKKKWKRK